MATFATQIHTSKKFRLGTEKKDVDGSVFVYLKGGTNVAAGSWVTFDENHAPTLVTTTAVGRVAISMAANTVTTNYSWYQVKGINAVAKTDTIVADKPLYIDGTAGRADDAVVNGDLIYGAISQTADTTNVATVWISYPFTTAVVIET